MLTPPLNKIPIIPDQLTSIIDNQVSKLLDNITFNVTIAIQEAISLPDDIKCDDPRIDALRKRIEAVNALIQKLQEIEKYWETGSFNGTAVNYSGGANVNRIGLSYNEDILIGGGELTMEWAAGAGKEAPIDGSSVFNIQKKYRPKIYRNTTYIVNFQIGLPNDIGEYTSADPNITNNRLDVYVSGSAVTTETQFLNIAVGDINPEPNTEQTLQGGYANGKQLGNRIGSIRSKNIPSLKASVTMQFRAEEDGEMDLKFVTRKGSWLIGEIEVLADKQTGFSPNYVRVFKRIPTEHLQTPLTFKFQYFDFRGNKADLETVAYGALFNGGNLYVQGNNNLITGSTYVEFHISGLIDGYSSVDCQ